MKYSFTVPSRLQIVDIPATAEMLRSQGSDLGQLEVFEESGVELLAVEPPEVPNAERHVILLAFAQRDNLPEIDSAVEQQETTVNSTPADRLWRVTPGDGDDRAASLEYRIHSDTGITAIVSISAVTNFDTEFAEAIAHSFVFLTDQG